MTEAPVPYTADSGLVAPLISGDAQNARTRADSTAADVTGADIAGADVTRVALRDLRVEYGAPALGIGTGSPRLSWKVESDDIDWAFDRYEVELIRDGRVEHATVHSAEQVFVPWPFAPLPSRSSAVVRVRAAAGTSWTAYSEPVTFEVGLLEAADWVAEFVSPRTLGGMDDGAPLVHGAFRTNSSSPVVAARLYVTAHGLYDFSINGHPVTGDVLTPGWSAYEHRLPYQVYDVTELVRGGQNSLSALLGNGWYRGQLVWPGNRSSYGDRLALLAQLELRFADGSAQTVRTDESWRARPSSILFDDFYDGQGRDLRISDTVGLDGSDEPGDEPVDVLGAPSERLVAPTAPPVRITERMPASTLHASPSGAMIVDFGQNVVGWVRVTVREGRAGSEVVVRHAEVLEHGELGLRPLRSAKATSRYILSGAPVEELVPTFTFNGFRYAEISGIDDLDVADVEALVLGTDLERVGWFECSDPRVNRLHANVAWSMRGNFLSVPTDCPQRDERLGWTGDIQVFSPTAAYLYDTAGFLSGWLEDLSAEQKPDGAVPFVIPDVLRTPDPVAAAWGDAATVVPTVLYRSYADTGMLTRQYPSMRAWVDKVASVASSNGLWDQGFQFGDWLDPTAPADDPGKAQADPAVVATAHYARSARLLADAADVLGFAADAEKYTALAEEIVDAFNEHFVTASGRVRSDCQTVYALALCWDLIRDPDAYQGASHRLVELVREARYRVSTGFVGTPLMLDALCRAGHPEDAYRMLMETECPSWLYSVEMGATTIWERWDSMLPDGTINPGEMTSFNHYAYGAVADWLHGTVAGLQPLAAGYRRVLIKPQPGAELTSASARHDSPFGVISVAWTIENGEFAMSFTVPYGVTAEVWLPGDDGAREFGMGAHELSARFRAPS
jgi:alpha-L-rhamnosidase